MIYSTSGAYVPVPKFMLTTVTLLTSRWLKYPMLSCYVDDRYPTYRQMELKYPMLSCYVDDRHPTYRQMELKYQMLSCYEPLS